MDNNKVPGEKIIELHLDNSIKNVWVDNIHVAIREDDVCCVRFSTSLPEGQFEQVRFMTNKRQLQDFIDTLCTTTNYYPSKKKPAKKK